MSPKAVILPRPGVTDADNKLPISAPSEEAFVAEFGQLLPQASYLDTPTGRAAYYELSSPPSGLQTTPEAVTRVLMVHGVRTPAIGLQPLASELCSRFSRAHIVLVDLWGHGLTDSPFVAHEPALFHSLLRGLLAKLEWKDAHMIGFSFGGSLTATFAAAFPDLVMSMVLVAPAGLLRLTQFDEVERSYLAGGEELEDQARDWVVRWLEGGKLVVPPDWQMRSKQGMVAFEAVRAWQDKHHQGHIASVLSIFRDGGVMDKHAEFAKAATHNIKNLAILGELDDICTIEDLAEVGFQNTVVIKDVGHGVVRERVHDVAQLIDDFWKTL